MINRHPSEPVCTRSEHRGLWMLKNIIIQLPKTACELAVSFGGGCPSEVVYHPYQRLRTAMPTSSRELGLISAVSERRSTTAGICCDTLLGRATNEGQPPPFRNSILAGIDPPGTSRSWRGQRPITSGGAAAGASRMGPWGTRWGSDATSAKFDRFGGNGTAPGAHYRRLQGEVRYPVH